MYKCYAYGLSTGIILKLGNASADQDASDYKDASDDKD